MTAPSAMEIYARTVRRDARIARQRSLLRRTAGPLLLKYLQVVPTVFSARGEFAAFRLLVSNSIALESLRDRAVLTLDSATEILGGFRFGKARNIYAYLRSRADLEFVEAAGLGERLPSASVPLTWSLGDRRFLLAVVPPEPPAAIERGGFRVVSAEALVRHLIGSYGLRTDLIAEIEAKLAPPT
jgi:hypothetical protein